MMSPGGCREGALVVVLAVATNGRPTAASQAGSYNRGGFVATFDADADADAAPPTVRAKGASTARLVVAADTGEQL